MPIPENYSAPSYTGLQEDIDVHLQAFRLGDILFTVCSCEQWYDQSRQHRDPHRHAWPATSTVGYDWGAQCTPDGDGTYQPDGNGTGTWSCPTRECHRARSADRPTTSTSACEPRSTTPPAGTTLENAAQAESEPTDPRRSTATTPMTRRPHAAALGYRLTVPISMANDYNGYIATYREYQRGDHYRKALTGWGPHSSDYMATRLVTMGRQLRRPDLALPTDQVQEQALAGKVAADLQVNEARARALGEVGTTATNAYEAILPDDGGLAEGTSQPRDTKRFGAAFFTWNGGSNYTDNPRVVVQRKVAGAGNRSPISRARSR